jgi:hypothetical protein
MVRRQLRDHLDGLSVLSNMHSQSYNLPESLRIPANIRRNGTLGIDVISFGDLRSPGLRTIVDNRNVPRLAWTFKTERVGKWGNESAYVDIDVQDGHIILSEPFIR